MIVDELWRRGEIGVFTGMRVIENPALPWDAIMVDTLFDTLVCGEVGHLRWQLDKGQVFRDMRADTTRILEEFEARTLRS